MPPQMNIILMLESQDTQSYTICTLGSYWRYTTACEWEEEAHQCTHKYMYRIYLYIYIYSRVQSFYIFAMRTQFIIM